MRHLPLERSYTYGPVLSRRLGRSLGINVLPFERKVCSFNCIYCHYGVTQDAARFPPARIFPGVEPVLRAVEIALRAFPEVDAITFSGNGEPTLHPYFRDLAFGVRQLRDRLAPQAKVTLFSNGTTLHLPGVRAALSWIDSPIMKLDAGDPLTFAAINRPAAGITYEAVLAGLKALDRVIIQTTFVDGPASNASGMAFKAWIDALMQIRPHQVQIYSTDYPVAEDDVALVPSYRLRSIAEDVSSQTALDVRAFWFSP